MSDCPESSPASVFNPCVVIPVYNHEHAIEGVVSRLEQYQLPCILVDDGSHSACAAILDNLAARNEWVTLVRRSLNGGKGAAVVTGFEAASQYGYSHALQIDADGQHDTNDVPKFLAQGRQFPDRVINGEPIYDDSIPKVRFYCRYLTHVWVWINTLSMAIGDSMCGFRLYPLKATMVLLDKVSLGRRMDFDTEVLVRLHWQGVDIKPQATAVHYPEDGVSHFDLWRDNVAISAMHAKLFLGMLLRLPQLLWRKVR